MTTSPLKFARSFEQLKSRLQSIPAGDMSLLELVEFWPELQAHDSVAAYQSYFDEYFPWLLKHTTERYLHDMLPAELDGLLGVLLDVRRSKSAKAVIAETEAGIKLVATEAARKYFYVGATDNALACLARARRAEPLRKAQDNALGGSADSCPADVHICRVSDGGSADTSEYDTICDLAQQLSDSNHHLSDTVNRIRRDWEVTREALSYEEAHCLFVEKNDRGDTVRGRLRLLHGTAEYRRAGAATNEVTFDNQLRAPDDPFVGVVYDALETVGQIAGRNNFAGRTNGHIRARYHVVESDHTFGGDSVGLAAGLIAYTQLLQPEILKHERFLACEAAFTGGVDKAGHLTPVNATTLRAKVGRAFFSPLRYLVLPVDNLDTAKECVAELQTEYPLRRLLLVGARTIGDVIEDHNIVRAEKVCIGQLVTRRVVKYSRATRIQVPILLALLYALICLLYPKAWVGFDWNPEYVRLTVRGFDALNADSVRLWSVEYKCDSIIEGTQHIVGDLDTDGLNEVAVAPKTPASSKCEREGKFYVYDDNGEFLFHGVSILKGLYPDSSGQDVYPPPELALATHYGDPVVLSATTQSYPSRAYLRYWDSKGVSIGWYINAGTLHLLPGNYTEDSDRGLILIGLNNRMGCGCMVMLPRRDCRGASPPYYDDYYDLSWIERGNQLCYILFPQSSMCKRLGYVYNTPQSVEFLTESKVVVEVCPDAEQPVRAAIRYHIDLEQGYRASKVEFDDAFIVQWNRLRQNLDSSDANLKTYATDLLHNVTYWTDSGWVTEGEIRSAEDAL